MSLVDRGVQTSRGLSANAPRMLQLKRKVKSAETAVKRLRQRLSALEDQQSDSGIQNQEMSYFNFLLLTLHRKLGKYKKITDHI